MDYFKLRYPDTLVVFDMSLVYIVVAFVTVFGNNLLVETFTLNTRINFGKSKKKFTLETFKFFLFRIFNVVYHFNLCCCM